MPFHAVLLCDLGAFARNLKDFSALSRFGTEKNISRKDAKIAKKQTYERACLDILDELVSTLQSRVLAPHGHSGQRDFILSCCLN
jgi:hypothetical protein